MKKYLYFNYFRSPDQARRDEYLYCIKSNLEKPYIDGFFVFLDDLEHASDIPQDQRIEFIHLGRRMEFQDVIDHAQENLRDPSVVIIINLDVFLANDKAWSNIDKEFFAKGHPHKAMVCTRHNLMSLPEGDKIDIELESTNWLNGNFCDAWVLTTPFQPGFAAEDFTFCVGNAPQCDNLMMGLMSRHYHTYSWGSKYIIMHLDVCRNLRYQDKLKIANDKTDMRAGDRREVHRNIPTQQPWQTLLESEQAPLITYTWFDYQRSR